MTGPVFDMPAAPTRRGYPSAHLIRIVDPLGEAIAWFAPEIGACCVSYALRQVRGAPPCQSVWWREIITASAVTRTFSFSPIGKDDDANEELTWQLVERDPSSCTMEWKDGEGPQAEHWQMVASLADTQLSLSLRMWNTGSATIQANARLRLTLSSPLDVTIRTARPTMTNELGEHRGDKSRRENAYDEVQIAVEAAPGASTVQTTYLGDEITYVVTYNPSDDSLLDLPPSGCHRRDQRVPNICNLDLMFLAGTSG